MRCLSRDGRDARGLVHHGLAGERVARDSDEGPQRKVTIARPFAVGKFEVTFDEWDACIADGAATHISRR